MARFGNPPNRKENLKFKCEHDEDDDTEKAFRVQLEVDGEWYWFPKSQCEVKVINRQAWIFVPQWLADEKELEEE